ncbi:DM13 domain-containing protein [Kribbella sp. NPDC051770]|uniref:DM13 domain-containing protein n=1 Tax=Kribbella sp. NPDC051770 TaxID=3155413 RepID=UPI003415631E
MRSHRKAIGISLVAGAAVVAAVALPLFQPWRLFTDTVVDEALPGAVPSTAPSLMPPSSKAPPTISGERPSSSTPSTPTALGRGTFITHEHDTTGTVAIVRLTDGRRILRLENLRTSDGPDLEVWLSDAKVVEGKAGWHVFDDGKATSLGQLKGNQGSQNYVIPDDVDLTDFSSVSIWCNRFNVSFGAAELKT